MAHFTAVDRQRLLWALSTLGQRESVDPGILRALLRGLPAREVAALQPAALLATLWACAQLEAAPHGLVHALARHVARTRAQLSSSQLAHAGLLLTQLGYKDTQVMGELAQQMGADDPPAPAHATS